MMETLDNRQDLGTYDFEGRTWFLSYLRGFVRAMPCTFKAYHDPNDELVGDVDSAALYISLSPAPPLAEAARRFRKNDSW